MEKVARRYEQSSDNSWNTNPEQSSVKSISIDQDLLTRIRALLLSRNDQNPPKTPHPSPDSAYRSFGYSESSLGKPSSRTAATDSAALKQLEKLNQAKSRKGTMVANRLDGPAGQLNDPDMDGPRRYPSHPSIHPDQSLIMSETALPVMSGLNHKTLGNVIGREPYNSVTSPSTSAKVGSKAGPTTRQYGKQKPKYVLQNTSPARPQLKDRGLHSSFQHIPGSYRSDVHQNGELASGTTDPSVVKRAAPLETENSLNNATPMILSLHDKRSNTTLRSSASAKLLHHPLLKPSVDFLNAGSIVQPILTSAQDHGHLHEGASEKQIEELASESKDNKSRATDLLATRNLMKESTINDSFSETVPITHVTSQKNATNAFDHRPRSSIDSTADLGVSNIASHPPQLPRSLSSKAYTPSVYSGPSSVHLADTRTDIAKNVGDEAVKSSFRFMNEGLTKTSGSHPKIIQEAGTVSILSRKLSTLNRAMSEVSLRSNPRSPSEYSYVKYGKSDFENEASRLLKSPSLPSLGDTITTNDSVDLERLAQQPKMVQKRSYQSPNSIIENSRAQMAEPKYHWVKHFLGRRSTSSIRQDAANLTMRPSHRDRHGVQGAAITRRRTMPHQDRLSIAYDGPINHQQMTSDSTDVTAVAKQQRKNTEAFTNVISDLETLLQEALSIARNAADKNENQDTPDVIARLTATAEDSITKNGLTEPHASPSFNGYNHARGDEGFPHFSRGSNDEHLEPTPIIQFEHHLGDHVAVVEPDAEYRHQGSFTRVRDGTPYPAQSVVQSRNPSMVPGSEIKNSLTEHAKHTAALLGLPEPKPKKTMLDLEDTQSSLSRRRSRQINASIAGSTPASVEVVDWSSKELSYMQQLEERKVPKSPPRRPEPTKTPKKDQLDLVVRKNQSRSKAQSRVDVQQFINIHNTPPIQPRSSSAGLRARAVDEEYGLGNRDLRTSDEDSAADAYIADFQTPGLPNRGTARQWPTGVPEEAPRAGPGALPDHGTITSLRDLGAEGPDTDQTQDGTQIREGYSLRNRHHFSIHEPQGFSLSRSHRRAPIARDWTSTRKRLVATVACVSTALMGLIIGIYAGEVPAIQYAIVDEHHYTILGNVVFYIGLAFPTALFFPLPLLHGRKPYTLGALAILLPLQFPQAVIVGTTRSPYVASYRVGLLLSRALSGFAMGFANINFGTILLDLFGSSLQSGNPHGEIVNQNDVRRHGSGMGIWLGIWTWCSIGSLGLGFFVGAFIISALNVAWGFWISIILIAVVLLLNVVTPETRRSPYRRSMAEVRSGSDISRRIARGEVMMHLYSTGPKYWWEEVVAGHVLCVRMLMQPGFIVLSLYLGWIYGQIVMIIVVCTEIE